MVALAIDSFNSLALSQQHRACITSKQITQTHTTQENISAKGL
jgi:hypothetical protein